MSVAYDIKNIIETLNLTNWPVDVGGFPERPEEVVSVRGLGGSRLLYQHQLGRLDFRLAIRGRDYLQAESELDQIITSLLGWSRQVFNNYLYWAFDLAPGGDVALIGTESRGLYLFEATLYIHRQRV
jgi:hypothetical protein